ncbi:hypothetical protein [uncultured Tateyamaria sp.]|uniref:hypothetical protein n=1 Tax=uncultured Tateyamaria sp. TaxID=455651 RepID=UPI0026284100|nr:hypothetical protein [uncultured Tateyamaria sp.]
MKKIVFGVASIFFLPTAHAYANCEAVLVQDRSELRFESHTLYAFSQLVSNNSSSFEEFEGGATIPIKGVPVEFDGQFRQETESRYLSQTNRAFSAEERVDYLSLQLSDAAISGFVDCTKAEAQGGVVLTPRNPTNHDLSVRFDWRSPPGISKETALEVEVLGGRLTAEPPANLRVGNDAFTRFVTREDGQDLRVRADAGGYTDDIYLPYTPKLETRIIQHTHRWPFNGVGYRVADQGDGHGERASPCINKKTKNGFIHLRSINVDFQAWGGGVVLDDSVQKTRRTYAEVVNATADQICLSISVYPLTRPGGDSRTFVYFTEYELEFRFID